MIIRLLLAVILSLFISKITFAQVDNPSAPGGSNTQVQFNDGGAFNGDAGLAYDKTNDALTISKALTTTTSSGLMCENPTAATSGNQKVSPAVVLRGRGYTGSASQTVDFLQYVLPFQGNPLSGIWRLMTSVNGATATELMSVDSRNGGAGITFTTPAAQANSSPGTTRLFTTNNLGSDTWQENKFSGTLRSALGYNSSGQISEYMSGGNGHAVYSCNSGLTSCSLISYNTATAFAHTGYGEFADGVSAGQTTAPTSILQSHGTTGLESGVISASGTLSTSLTNVLCDGTTAAACTGTPSNSCASHANQGACENYDAHGGCTWYAGSSCDVYNNESGMGTCLATSGCTAETSACSGGDEYTCLSGDDSYGGDCAWNYNDCSILDEGTCGITSGCTPNYSDCSSYDDNYGSCTGTSGCTWSGGGYDCSASDGTDQGTCEGNSGCIWNSGDNTCYGTCYGTYFSSCSGSYYTCTGTYYTGTCSGTYGAACTGTSTCAGIDDSGNCGSEAGCTWSSVLNLTLPNNPPNGREYRIKNIASGGADCVILPYSGYDIDGSSSLTLAAYKDSTLLVYFGLTADCSTYNGDESTCGSTSGCTQYYSYCVWDGSCTGSGTCTGIGDEGTCNSTQYFSSCSGTYYTAKRWHEMAKRY